MIDEKCKNCPELVIPYYNVYRKPNHKLPDELKTGTCKCNVSSIDRPGRGYYGDCSPSDCKGPGHHYYFTGHVGPEYIKFID